MEQLFDFFFCPIHGIFAPINWAWVGPMLSSSLSYGKVCWSYVASKVVK